MIRITKLSPLCVLTVSGLVAALSGCAVGTSVDATSPVQVVAASKGATGTIMGGQYPIGGVYVQIYSVGTSGYGSAATPLLPTIGPSVVYTTASGNFTLPSTSSFCPVSNPLVYLVGTGGQVIPAMGATPATTNNNVALMVALGACNSIESQNILVNEVTTVASVWALAPYMTGPTNIGSTSTTLGKAGIANAFATVNMLVNTANGTAPGPLATTLGATVPTSTINTLAEIVAYCINSSGVTSYNDGSPCGNLFYYANPGGTSATAPADTVTAAMHIAQNPASNVTSLFQNRSPQEIFSGELGSAPNDWTLGVKYANAVHTPTGLALDPSGNVYVSNSGSPSLTVLTAASSASPAAPTSTSYSGLSSPTSIAIDQSNDIWMTNGGSNSIFVLNTTADPSSTQITGNGLSSPTSVAIDGSGNVWVANAGTAGISGWSYVPGTNTATALSGSPFTGGGVSSPVSIAISPK